ncbi:hypothetical protein SRHO_G00106650 [Serrasalmus rhombeus]
MMCQRRTKTVDFQCWGPAGGWGVREEEEEEEEKTTTTGFREALCPHEAKSKRTAWKSTRSVLRSVL